LTEQDLIIYENELIRIYSPNIHKAGGTIFIYLHKPSGQVIIVDCGIGFSAHKMNKDITKPDLTEMELVIMRLIRDLIRRRNPKPIDALLTHGHFDHIAGVEILSREFEMMWHGSPTTEAMLNRSRHANKRSNEEIKENSKIKFNPLKAEYGTLNLGKFVIKYFPTVHSIPETLSFIVETIDGFKGLHMAEFRTKECSLFPGLSDKMFRGVTAGAEGKEYDVVLFDALRSEPGISRSEDTIEKPIEKILTSPDFPEEGALILPFISSKVGQIGIIQKIANRHGCTMFPAGRAMAEMTAYARSKGWIEEQIKFTDKKFKRLLIPCTGSQNEPGAALPRALEGSARDLCLVPTDWLFMVQCIIPQYKDTAGEMYRNILRRCNRFVAGYSDIKHIGLHTGNNKVILADKLIGEKFETSSGHGRLGDQKLLKAAAPCKNNNYIGYQCEEEPTEPADAEVKPSEIEKPITTKSELLTLVDNYITSLNQRNMAEPRPRIY